MITHTIIISSIVLFYICGILTPYVVQKISLFLYIRTLRQAVIPVKADPSKLCKTGHQWISASVITNEGSSQREICRICGLISGTNKVAKQETIDKIEENKKYYEIEGKIYKEFLDKEDDAIKAHFEKELKNGLDFNKLVAVHSAGMSFPDRYDLYKMEKSEEINKEMLKSNA